MAHSPYTGTELGKRYVLAIDYSSCIGCHLCELACSIKHENIINPWLSRITILTLPESPVSIQRTCMQCRDAPCMRVCPVNAITYNPETGAYEINQEKCIGCYECVYACPFGAITINPRGQVIKCDLCGGDPECVKVCPTNALIYGPADEVVKELNKRKAEAIATVIDTEKLTVRRPIEAVEKAREAVRFLYEIWEKVGKKPT
jgi:carbon-monoxide dehydrogenase iron sulfur subunit